MLLTLKPWELCQSLRTTSYLIMKKLLIVLLSTILAIPAWGQNAVQTLDAVSKKYSSFSSYEAAFTMASGSGTSKGSLLAKGNMYKVAFAGQELYNNGKDVYTYIPETNEVNITSYNAGDESDISPNNIFKLYKKGYTATYKQEKTIAGKRYDIIELKPKSKSEISKVELTIGKTDRLLSSWTIAETSGNKSTYTITKFTPNVPANPASFTFDKSKYPKVEVIDLR